MGAALLLWNGRRGFTDSRRFRLPGPPPNRAPSATGVGEGSTPPRVRVGEGWVGANESRPHPPNTWASIRALTSVGRIGGVPGAVAGAWDRFHECAPTANVPGGAPTRAAITSPASTALTKRRSTPRNTGPGPGGSSAPSASNRASAGMEHLPHKAARQGDSVRKAAMSSASSSASVGIKASRPNRLRAIGAGGQILTKAGVAAPSSTRLQKSSSATMLCRRRWASRNPARKIGDGEFRLKNRRSRRSPGRSAVSRNPCKSLFLSGFWRRVPVARKVHTLRPALSGRRGPRR